MIAERIGLELDYGSRPWGIMTELFGFRNDIAHGKSVAVPEEFVVSADEYENHLHEFATTKWEKFCTQPNAEKARNDVEAMVRALHQAAGIPDDFPFIGGLQTGHARLADV